MTPGSGIRDGWKVSLRIRDEQSGSYFLELRNHFLGLKYLNSLIRIRDPDGDSSNLGSGIPDGKKLDPGSGINIPDPQHCKITNNFLCGGGGGTGIGKKMSSLSGLLDLSLCAKLVPWLRFSYFFFFSFFLSSFFL